MEIGGGMSGELRLMLFDPDQSRPDPVKTVSIPILHGPWRLFFPDTFLISPVSIKSFILLTSSFSLPNRRSLSHCIAIPESSSNFFIQNGFH